MLRNTTSKCYRCGQPVHPKEDAQYLWENLELFGSPFVFVKGSLSEDDFSRFQRILGKMAGEFYGSHGYRSKFILISNPEENKELQNLIFEEMGGLKWAGNSNGNYAPGDSEKKLAEYFARFCKDPELLRLTALSLMWNQKHAASLRNSLPDDD